jgi:hypothetical protein
MMTEIPSNQIERFIGGVRRRQGRERLVMGVFGLMVAANLVYAVSVLVSGHLGPGEAALPLMLTVVLALLFLRLWWAIRREHRGYRAMALPSAEAVRATADATRKRLREHRLLATLLPTVVLPLFALALWQLWVAGKALPGQLAWLGAFILLAFGVVETLLVRRMRERLKPQLEELENLYRQFRASDE